MPSLLEEAIQPEYEWDPSKAPEGEKALDVIGDREGINWTSNVVETDDPNLEYKFDWDDVKHEETLLFSEDPSYSPGGTQNNRGDAAGLVIDTSQDFTRGWKDEYWVEQEDDDGTISEWYYDNLGSILGYPQDGSMTLPTSLTDTNTWKEGRMVVTSRQKGDEARNYNVYRNSKTGESYQPTLHEFTENIYGTSLNKMPPSVRDAAIHYYNTYDHSNTPIQHLSLDWGTGSYDAGSFELERAEGMTDEAWAKQLEDEGYFTLIPGKDAVWSRGQGKQRALEQDIRNLEIACDQGDEEACTMLEGVSKFAKGGLLNSNGDNKMYSQSKTPRYAEGGMLSPSMPTEEEMFEEAGGMPMPEEPVEETGLTEEDAEVLALAMADYPELETILNKLGNTEGAFEGEGPVNGPGTGTSDSIDAKLSDGEFVFTATAVKQIGVDKLRKMMAKAEEDYNSTMEMQTLKQADDTAFANGGLLTAPEQSYSDSIVEDIQQSTKKVGQVAGKVLGHLGSDIKGLLKSTGKWLGDAADDAVGAISQPYNSIDPDSVATRETEEWQESNRSNKELFDRPAPTGEPLPEYNAETDGMSEEHKALLEQGNSAIYPEEEYPHLYTDGNFTGNN